MFQVEIEYNCDSKPDVELYINDILIEYKIIEKKIVARVDKPSGLYILSIKLRNNEKLSIKNVSVDSVNIRQFLFLSWLQNHNQKLQPCTDIWIKDQIWHCPISFPMNLLISNSCEKFDSNDLGTNLYEKYEIFYPESIIVNDNFPQLIKDFFAQNYDFYVYNKKENANPFANPHIPYFCYDYNIDRQSIYKEITQNLDYLFSLEKVKPVQHHYNQVDIPKDAQIAYEKLNWRTIYSYSFDPKGYHNKEDFEFDKIKFPALYKFYQELPVKKIYGSMLGLLPANGYIAPHRDFLGGLTPQGCSQFYFSINAQEGNYFKMHNIGLVPFKDRSVILNNQTFTHALVNQSDQPRWIIAMFAEPIDNFIENYVHI